MSLRRLFSLFVVVALVCSLSVRQPTSAAVTSSVRDDVLVVFDGRLDDRITQQHPTAAYTSFSESSAMARWGNGALFVDMPTVQRMNQKPFTWLGGNFAMMFLIRPENRVNIAEYPLSELMVYNTAPTAASGDSIQINYVDPDNSAGAGDDSYNANLPMKDQPTGWHRLKHRVEDSALPGWTLHPDNIDHIRVSWLSTPDNYHEIDWFFDCLIVAKPSFYEARTAAETVMAGKVNTLQVPTAETFDDLRESIEAVRAAWLADRAEFPNYYLENEERLQTVLKAYDQLLEQQRVREVAAAIAALPAAAAVTAADREAIRAARASYNALPADQKALITGTEKLQAAEESLAKVLIAALPQAASVTLEHLSAVRAARTAYSELDRFQKPRVGAIDKLTAAETRLAALTDERIAALPAAGDLTDDDLSLVADVQGICNGLTAVSRSKLTGAGHLQAIVAAATERLGRQTRLTVRVGDGTKGGRAAVPLSIEGSLTAADLLLTFDPAKLRFVSCEGQGRFAGSAVWQARPAGSGQVLLSFAGTALPQGEALDRLCIVTFDVLEELPDGEITAVEARLRSAWVTVKGDHPVSFDVTASASATAGGVRSTASQAKAVSDRLAALPAQPQLADKPAVLAARAAYDDLSDAAKQQVSTYEKLTEAEAAIARLELLQRLTYGDVDGNGAVNAADALLALQHSVRLVTLEGDAFTAADVSGDGAVNASDALLILQHSVRLIDRFPVA